MFALLLISKPLSRQRISPDHKTGREVILSPIEHHQQEEGSFFRVRGEAFSFVRMFLYSRQENLRRDSADAKRRGPATRIYLPQNRNPLPSPKRKNPLLFEAGSFSSLKPSGKRTYALSTAPERRQRVQTCIVLGVPSTTTLTLRTFGCCCVNARRETCERVMLIFLPK